jgi:hypothetical protein
MTTVPCTTESTTESTTETTPAAPVTLHLFLVASIGSGIATVLLPHLLTGPAAMNGSAKGTALVVVTAGVPTLTLASRRARRGSLSALAVTVGAAAFLVYNAFLLVFATPLNRAFPIYEAMLGLGIWTLSRLLLEVWRRCGDLCLPSARWAASFVLCVVALNLAAWLSKLVPALVSDHPRSVLDGTGLTTNPVYVQDLAFWLPALAWVAVGMWRGHGPRTLLGAAALCFWVLESASVAVDQWWGHHADPTSTAVSVAVVPLFVALGALTSWPLVSVLRTLAWGLPNAGTADPALVPRARSTTCP